MLSLQTLLLRLLTYILVLFMIVQRAHNLSLQCQVY